MSQSSINENGIKMILSENEEIEMFSENNENGISVIIENKYTNSVVNENHIHNLYNIWVIIKNENGH